MKPEVYIHYRNKKLSQINEIRKSIRTMELIADQCSIPDIIRPAQADDIKVDAIIWYKDGDNGNFWMCVDEVLRPSDPFKAYCGHDGSRYGLDGAYVEVKA